MLAVVTQIAEENNMSTLLAHCEQYIALNYRTMSVEHKQLSKLSQSSLRRIMDCLAGREAPFRDQLQPYLLQDSAKTIGRLSFCKLCYCVIRGTGVCPCNPVIDGHNHKGNPSRLQSVQKITCGALNALADLAVPSTDVLIKWQQA